MSYAYEAIYFDDPLVPRRVMDVFRPDRETREVAVYMVHGGGWRGGSREGPHRLLEAFRNEGFVCGSGDYRLAGVHIGEQITDVRHGYDLFLSRLRDEGRPPRVVVFGSSAGAHLAALLALAAPGDCGEATTFREYALREPWVPPVGAALQATPTTFEPWEDIFPGGWVSMQDIVGVPYEDDPEAYRRVSPVEHVKADSCPVFLLEAENEHMFPLERNRRFIEKMKAHGRRAELKVYTNAEHGFFYDVTRRQQKEAFADLLRFIESLE